MVGLLDTHHIAVVDKVCVVVVVGIHRVVVVDSIVRVVVEQRLGLWHKQDTFPRM